MPARQENTRLAAGIALSLLLHALFAGILGWSAWGSTGGLVVQPPPSDEIPLGIRDSDAATITWIGFQEPTPNVAAKSTLEQAAQEIGGAQPSSRAIRQLTQQAAENAAEQAQQTLRALSRLLQELDLSIAEEPPAEATEEVVAKAEPQPVPTPPTNPSPQPGNAERQADAVSIEDPVKIEWGKPIAAEGLEILTRTKGPDFTAYTSVTARPDPLFVEISFGPPNEAGLASVAYVDLVGSSGNPDIDRPYLDVIYLWRARGERVDVLSEGETVKVRTRIIVRL